MQSLPTATTTLSTGASVYGGISSLVSDVGREYSVVCGIEVENYTKWPLVAPFSSMDYGYFRKPPVEVMPGTKECFVCHNHPVVASGIFGTVSWQIAGCCERVVVMFSCPFSFDIYRNRLAVGVVGNHSHDAKLTKQMYSDPETFFSRGYYYDGSNPIMYKDKYLTLTGTLGTGHKTEGKISVFPNGNDDLAPAMGKPAVLHLEYLEIS